MRRSLRALGPGAILAVWALAASGCATRGLAPRQFLPAGAEENARALAAWKAAVDRALLLPPSRLLYDARIKHGIASLSGTLALTTSPPVRGTLTGPFGSTLAIYEDGALRGDRFPPVVLEPETFLSILAGVWSAPSPEVRGFEAGDALLVWQSAYPVQGVLDVPGQRFRSLLLVRDGRAFEASYSGSVDPWPARVELEDTSTANRLSLSLQAREPL